MKTTTALLAALLSATAHAQVLAPNIEVGLSQVQRDDRHDGEFTTLRVTSPDGRVVTSIDEVGDMVFDYGATIGFAQLEAVGPTRIVGYVRVYAGGRAVLIPAYEPKR